MPRQRKYRTDRALRKAIERYFQSISRESVVTELVETGKLDRYGHPVKEPRPVVNGLGEEMRRREFFVPPTVGGLTRALGISRDTWARYCDWEENPEFGEVTAWAREVLRSYLEEELLTREGKNIQGVVFTLQNGYGMSEKTTVELGPRAARAAAGADREELLRLLEKEMADGPLSASGTPGTDG